MKIIVINGPNLNLLGMREKNIYGTVSFTDYFNSLLEKYPSVSLGYFQTNVEGEIINKVHEVGFDNQAVVLNAGGYTHTSVAIADAIAAIATPVIEVHISNIYSREEYRQKSLLSKHCQAVVCGMGLMGYDFAIDYAIKTNLGLK